MLSLRNTHTLSTPRSCTTTADHGEICILTCLQPRSRPPPSLFTASISRLEPQKWVFHDPEFIHVYQFFLQFLSFHAFSQILEQMPIEEG